MMSPKKLLGLLLALSAAQASFCQEEKTTQVENVTRFTFISPGFGHEQKLGKSTTLVGHVFLSPYVSFLYSDAIGLDSELMLEPSVSLQYRYYYNFKKRQEKGHRTAKNSLNYIAPKYMGVFTKRRMSVSYLREENMRAINTLGVVWGLQRNLPGRLSLDFNAGLGYEFTKGHTYDDQGKIIEKQISGLTTMGGLTLGIWLGKKETE